jgi:hypothetical protein
MAARRTFDVQAVLLPYLCILKKPSVTHGTALARR